MADWLGGLEGQGRIGSHSLINASRDCSIQDLIFLWFVSVQKEVRNIQGIIHTVPGLNDWFHRYCPNPFNVWDIFHKCVYSSIN